MRVLIGPAGQIPLLGLTSLEMLGLKVNPVERRLEPSEFTLYATLRRPPHRDSGLRDAPGISQFESGPRLIRTPSA